MDKFDPKTKPESNLLTVVLIGLMGSGKSSVARSLAWRWQCEVNDTDAMIEAAAKMPIADIFAQQGEAEFRRVEHEQLRAALEYSGVIATGGGIVIKPVNRALLQAASKRGVLVVYLRASASELALRIRRQPGKRPLIDGNGVLDLEQTQKRVESLLQERGPLYESVAGLIIESGAPDVSSVAEQIEWALASMRT